MKFHVKKGDEVVVLAGKEKGKRGKIIAVLTNVALSADDFSPWQMMRPGRRSGTAPRARRKPIRAGSQSCAAMAQAKASTKDLVPAATTCAGS